MMWHPPACTTVHSICGTCQCKEYTVVQSFMLELSLILWFFIFFFPPTYKSTGSCLWTLNSVLRWIVHYLTQPFRPQFGVSFLHLWAGRMRCCAFELHCYRWADVSDLYPLALQTVLKLLIWGNVMYWQKQWRQTWEKAQKAFFWAIFFLLLLN